MFTRRPRINEVFTPRRKEVNKKIYVERPEYEANLKMSLQGTLQPVLFGYSGTGKSWLYRKVLRDLGAEVAVINCSNAARFDSLIDEITRAVFVKTRKELESITSEVSSDLSAVVLKGGGKSSRKYEIQHEDPLLSALRHLRKRAGSSPVVLVIDNLEFIFKNDKLMDELGNVIVLTDDSTYAKYEVRLLIVGTPTNVLEYFAKTRNLAPVANRLQELNEVRGFEAHQVGELLMTGFNDLLKARIDAATIGQLRRHVYRVTLGFPQMVHEYCEILAHKLDENRWIWREQLMHDTDLDWLRLGLRRSYVVVESLMNEKESKIGRKNQVLHTIGHMNAQSFSVRQVEEKLRHEFPGSTHNKKLGIGRILTQLAQITPSVIRSSGKGRTFEIVDPRCLMCLRLVLRKDERDRVHKLGFRM